MVLITGANGYVAKQTIQQLVASNVQVKALVRSEASFDKIRRLGATPIKGDVTDSATLMFALAGVDEVIHLAAVNRNRGASTMQAVNAQGTINLVNAAKAAGVKHIVTVVGLGADASKPYPLAQTQGIAIDYLIQSGVPYTILEASVIFGEGDEFINTLAGLARVPPVMVVPGNGKSKFQPIAVQDVATCAVRSLYNPDALNKRLQICGSEVLTLEAIIDAILAELKLKRLKVHMPVSLLKIAVWAMDKFLPKAPITPSLLAQIGVDNVATANMTEILFHVKPQILKVGIDYVHSMTLLQLIKRSLGAIDHH